MKDGGIPLGALSKDVAAGSGVAFLQRHGHGFLIRFSSLRAPTRLIGDDWLTKPTKAAYATSQLPTLGCSLSAADSRRVYPLRQRRTRTDSLITIGRSPQNDVCINDASISKLHACFKLTGAGFRLSDKNSTNGTWLGRVKLSPDCPYDVTTGKSLRFGNVQLVFMDATDILAFLKTLG